MILSLLSRRIFSGIDCNSLHISATSVAYPSRGFFTSDAVTSRNVEMVQKFIVSAFHSISVKHL